MPQKWLGGMAPILFSESHLKSLRHQPKNFRTFVGDALLFEVVPSLGCSVVWRHGGRHSQHPQEQVAEPVPSSARASQALHQICHALFRLARFSRHVFANTFLRPVTCLCNKTPGVMHWLLGDSRSVGGGIHDLSPNDWLDTDTKL